jgi:hypothetical protein
MTIFVYFMAIWYVSWLFGIFHGYLVYFMAIWYISWLFGMFPFWNAVPRKIWQPCPEEAKGVPQHHPPPRKLMRMSEGNHISYGGFHRHYVCTSTQGCQIFLRTAYQNGKK